MTEPMNPPEYVDVDPSTLHLPPSRASGADLAKLTRQVAKYGSSMQGMPTVWAYRGTDGALMIYDDDLRRGDTRAALLYYALEHLSGWRSSAICRPLVASCRP